VRHADGVTRRILTVGGWLSQFQPYSPVAAANRKWCSRALPDVAGVICRRIATGRGEKGQVIWFMMELDGFMRNLTTSMQMQIEFEEH